MNFPFNPNSDFVEIVVNTSRKYLINIGASALYQYPDIISGGYEKAFLVTDNHLMQHQKETINSILQHPRVEGFINIKAGENQKNWANLNRILTSMLEAGLNRNSLLIAFGGGVIGDMAGLAASLFMRGIDCLMIPTSLLAMVDSSVGGKTAVNHPLGKNLIGTFSQPLAVHIDTDFLATLPQRHLLNGIAEVVKYGYIFDRSFLSFIDSNMTAIKKREESILLKIVGYCCAAKSEIVTDDEYEGGIRKKLNLGHTFGHAIEAYFHYKKILHGEAVNIGMIMANYYAEKMGLVEKGFYQKNFDLHKKLKPKLEMLINIDEAQLIGLMSLDKKSYGKGFTLVLPNMSGVEIMENIKETEIRRIFKQLSKDIKNRILN